MTIKIALTGRMGAGKDTVADIITKIYPRKVIQRSFAEYLKHHFHEIFPYIPEEPKPRKHYQQFGQYMRAIDPDVWIKRLDYGIKQTYANTQAIIITDLRQENEYYYCKNNGFHVIEVAAPTELRVQRMIARGDKFSINDMDHETESGIFPADSVIYNDGDIEKLNNRIESLLASIRVL